MELIERILIAAVKRTPGASDQIGYAQTDDDGHQRGDELEAAHEILCVLHGAPSLMGSEPENRVVNGNSRTRALGAQAASLQVSAACRDPGKFALSEEITCAKMLPAELPPTTG